MGRGTPNSGGEGGGWSKDEGVRTKVEASSRGAGGAGSSYMTPEASSSLLRFKVSSTEMTGGAWASTTGAGAGAGAATRGASTLGSTTGAAAGISALSI